MENYRKAGAVEQPSLCPFSDLLHGGTPVVRVRDGSKIRNLMRFSQSRMEGRAEKASESGAGGGGGEEEEASGESRLCRQIVFAGVGPSVSKTITCVEILKRRLGGLHQVTRLVYSSLQETWEPLEPSAGLDSITVTRNIPSIWVLLSRDPLDPNADGYQAPGSFDALWVQAAAREERENQRRRSGGRGGSGRGKGSRRPTAWHRDERKTSVSGAQ
ncbi:Ribonuclease P protein subunit p25-like protein [Bagarius yarrelli]|uniref:Ribonuclease P protein subunit p25-like protein n=1 Tax=Bagarius yarrelli TaxID=175774 RepID=A0A556V7H5_BAGYA|nr:Ribonuclease P protein subunit p25-like protein [Bagarius yarrelli]